MHIVLVETTAVRGFDTVEEMVSAGIEVTFVAQDIQRHLTLHDPAKMALAARLVEVPELGQPVDLAERSRGNLGDSKPDGVICRKEAFARDVARFAQVYGLRGETHDTAGLLTDKSAVRECLGKVGLGSLRWKCVRSLEEAIGAGREIGYPLVVKPVSGGSSLGVTVVQDEGGLAAAISSAARISAGSHGRPPVILLEEFAPGPLVSAEMLVQNGVPFLLGFAERMRSPHGNTAEIGGHFPAMLERFDDARAFAMGVVLALGIRDSAVHVEMIIAPHGPELVEVNGRVAGFVVMQQMSHALGRSITMDLFALATGQPLAPMGEAVQTVAIQTLWAERGGRVSDIRPPGLLGPHIVDCGLSISVGDRISPLRSNVDRFGYVMARGDDARTATENAAIGARRLLERVEIVADDPTESMK